jgi:hypothetical protein
MQFSDEGEGLFPSMDNRIIILLDDGITPEDQHIGSI